jgi:Ser-tRNA(Ala) deacylase AlaX
MIDYQTITEEEKQEYIEKSIDDIGELIELLKVLEESLITEEPEHGIHAKALFILNSIKKSAIESIEKSIGKITFLDDLKN